MDSSGKVKREKKDKAKEKSNKAEKVDRKEKQDKDKRDKGDLLPEGTAPESDSVSSEALSATAMPPTPTASLATETSAPVATPLSPAVAGKEDSGLPASAPPAAAPQPAEAPAEPAPSLAPLGTPSSEASSRTPPSKAPYLVDPEVKDRVLKALEASDVDVKIRNKLYAAMGRALDQPWIPGAVLARWAEDSKDRKRKFAFLQEWVQDTAFGKVVVEERHVVLASTYEEQQYGWFTKMDLMVKFQGFQHEEGRAYVEKVISGARTRPHPQWPKDPEMKLYRVLHSLVVGQRSESKREKGYAMESEVETKEGAEAVMAALKREEKLMGKRAQSDDEGSEAGRGKKRPKKATAEKDKDQELNQLKVAKKPKAAAKKATAKKQQTEAESMCVQLNSKLLQVKTMLAKAKRLPDSPHNTTMQQALQAAIMQVQEALSVVEEAICNETCQDEATKVSIKEAHDKAMATADSELAFASPRVQA